MRSFNIRVSERSYEAIRSLAARYGGSMQSIVDQAIENQRRKMILEETNAAFAALKADKAAWAEERKERELWETASSDGLENE